MKDEELTITRGSENLRLVKEGFMKKNILAVLAMTLTTITAFADCRDAYEHASKMRDIRNEIIVGVSIVGTAGGAFVTTGVVESLLVMGYSLSMMGAWPMTDFKRQGEGIYKNNFDKLLIAFSAAETGTENKHLNRIVEKSIKEADLEQSPELERQARTILADAFNDETFCPIIKVRKNGEEKRAVFNRSALIKFVAEKL